MDNTTNKFNDAGQVEWGKLRPDQQEKLKAFRALRDADVKTIDEDYTANREQYIEKKKEDIEKRQATPVHDYVIGGGPVQRHPLTTHQIADQAEIEVKCEYQARRDAVKERHKTTERNYLDLFETARDITLPRPGRDI
jgi:hypothetical protein